MMLSSSVCQSCSFRCIIQSLVSVRSSVCLFVRLLRLYVSTKQPCNRTNTMKRDGLLSLQKTFVRILTGSHRLSHADPLFARLGILKVTDLYDHSVRIFSFKLHRKMLPSGVSSMFKEKGHVHNTRGASSSPYDIHSDCRSIKSIAPRVWIQLDQLDRKCKPDQKLKTSPSIASFKERSKRDLLGSYEVCRVRACLSCAVSAPALAGSV